MLISSVDRRISGFIQQLSPLENDADAGCSPSEALATKLTMLAGAAQWYLKNSPPSHFRDAARQVGYALQDVTTWFSAAQTQAFFSTEIERSGKRVVTDLTKQLLGLHHNLQAELAAVPLRLTPNVTIDWDANRAYYRFDGMPTEAGLIANATPDVSRQVDTFKVQNFGVGPLLNTHFGKLSPDPKAGPAPQLFFSLFANAIGPTFESSGTIPHEFRIPIGRGGFIQASGLDGPLHCHERFGIQISRALEDRNPQQEAHDQDLLVAARQAARWIKNAGSLGR